MPRRSAAERLAAHSERVGVSPPHLKQRVVSALGKPSTTNESPRSFARRIGLPIDGGAFHTLEHPALLALAVAAYWQRRPSPQPTEDVA